MNAIPALLASAFLLLFGLAVVPKYRPAVGRLVRLSGRLMVGLAVGVCTFWHFVPAAIPTAVSDLVEPIIQRLRSDYTAFSIAEQLLGSPWLGLGILVLLSGLALEALWRRLLRQSRRSVRRRSQLTLSGSSVVIVKPSRPLVRDLL